MEGTWGGNDDQVLRVCKEHKPGTAASNILVYINYDTLSNVNSVIITQVHKFILKY